VLGTSSRGGDDVDVDTRYNSWLDLVAELSLRPTPEFPQKELTEQLVDTFKTKVSWHWAAADGEFGVEHMSHPVPNWPSESDLETWRLGMSVHPLVCWMRRVGNDRAMSIGRVPRETVPSEGFGILREALRPVGLDEELSIPYEQVDGILRTVVLSQTGEDYGDEDFDLALRIQPLVQLLARQCQILRTGSAPNPRGLTGREVAVVRLLRAGGTAGAIGHRLGISPRTVEVHLSHIYRKLGVRDRLQAVLVAEDLGILPARWSTDCTSAAPGVGRMPAENAVSEHEHPVARQAGPGPVQRRNLSAALPVG
jgi:DNA-binding CsgD family transcriptional regulator